MNKNKMILMVSLLVSSVSILPMSEGDKRLIRKELYSNYENDRINIVILAEAGLSLSEIIDRDIQILSEHENTLLKKMDAYKNRMIWDPAFDKMGAGFFGTIAALAGGVHTLAAEKIRELTDNGTLLTNTGNWFIDYVEYFKMSTQEYRNLVRKNLAMKASQDPEAMVATLCVLPAYIITFAAGGICLKKIYNIMMHPRQLRACLQKTQKRFERNQAIIAQLKEIKHTLAI